MMRAYMASIEGKTFAELTEFVSSLPVTFEGERNLSISSDGYVELDGVIDGLQEVTLRPREGVI